MIRTVSFSEISTFRQCPHKHELSYRERWEAPTTSDALVKGKVFHQVLELYYKTVRRMQRGKLREDRFAPVFGKLCAPLLYREDGSQSEMQELVEWMLDGYTQRYGFDDEWEILATEHAAEVWLPSSLPVRNKRGQLVTPARRSNFRLKIRIDLVARQRFTGNLYLWDHKTGQNLPTEKELAIDDQFGLYTWGMRQLGRPVHGAVYNAVRTQRNKDPGTQTLDSRHSRTLVYRTEEELDWIAYEAYLTSKRMYSIRGHADRSPNPDTCRWRCPYLEPCLSGRKMGPEFERQFLREAGFVQNFERH